MAQAVNEYSQVLERARVCDSCGYVNKTLRKICKRCRAPLLDPLAQRQILLSRGYEGSLLASYGVQPGELPIVGVRVDLYSNAAGAYAAMTGSGQT
jgi:hypothetical protein